ncbi:MAG TPA: SDR family oxidoreductase [Pseudonocardia sp.]|jgi:NAD(P)-dependent dehydrogenase (short-subunit alcohol dehydrogenase family)|uniref:SDR family NAD(P)-dependent oxidoreductase n=1 Tax=Pseudonocardia sp. TaxID=60912 RepID=UPI002B4B251C|nr:SDR family oxidoreductase [Pseudonocardia sp.]HLU54843.1 SDR family oxidoreductase [Pseudonocardia sp.]
MTDRFAGRRVAVTGAAGGIGLAICERLAAQGAQVHGLDLKGLDALPAAVTGHTVDVTSEESVTAVVRALYADDERPVDLVNSAGIVENNVAAEEMPLSEFDRIMAVNLRGVFLTCREFGRELLARGGGAIVNIASMSGNAIVNFPQRQCAYNASKAGVSALTRSLAVEWGPRGVRLNTVSPGYVDTPLTAGRTDMHAQWRSGIVLDRFAQPAEVAAAVEYFLSEDSAYCCGAELLIDGGFSLR